MKQKSLTDRHTYKQIHKGAPLIKSKFVNPSFYDNKSGLFREAAKKVIFNDRALNEKRGRGKERKKNLFFRRTKFRRPLSSRGRGVKVLMARSSKKNFCAASLILLGLYR